MDGFLCRYLLERERGNTGAVTCVFNSDGTDVAVSIDIQQKILVKVASFGYFGGKKFDLQRIGVLEILNLHGSKDLSKKALCTVSPSGNSLTR